MSTPRQIAYALLAALGLIGPWYWNVQHTLAGGTLVSFVTDQWANPATRSIGIDITAAALAFTIWMVVEARRLGMRWWLWIVMTYLVAFGFACPLFFLMRERRLAALADASAAPEETR